MLVGNKCDNERTRVVSSEEGRAVAASVQAGFVEASAKDDLNVAPVFLELVRLYRDW